jgi:hypothetical protein
MKFTKLDLQQRESFLHPIFKNWNNGILECWKIGFNCNNLFTHHSIIPIFLVSNDRVMVVDYKTLTK